MGKPQVTLTLAGDSSQLEKTFGAVGASSKRMADDVGSSSKRVAEESESAFDRAGEGADGAEGKAQGFSDTLTGVADIGAGTGEIMKGNLFEGFVTVGQGAADLAGGLATFLIPALKKVYEQGISNVLATGRQTAANIAAKGAAIASAAATNVMTIAQKGLNLAMRMNPIGLVITAIVLLAGVFITAYKKSETFRNIVNGALGAVKNAAAGAYGWFKKNWPLLLAILGGPFGLAVLVIKKHKDSILAFFKSVPGAIGGFFKGVGETVTAPFRNAFQGIKDAWNNTVGGKGFTVPDWIPGVGGKSFNIPYFHTGGVVSGALGAETLAVLKAGERVTGGSNGGGGGGVLTVRADGRWGKQFLLMFKDIVRIEGGAKVVFEL